MKNNKLCLAVILFLFSFSLVSAASLDSKQDDSDIGFVLLDDGVIKLWNPHYDYFFDSESAIQLTNHFDEYWTENVFCLGYRNELKKRSVSIEGDGPEVAAVDSWKNWDRKCTDDLDMEYEIDSDFETYVRLTFTGVREFENNVAEYVIDYYLELEDKDILVDVRIKNLKGEPIDRDLGFNWKIRDIKIGDLYDNNQINVGWGYYFDLDDDLNEVYSNGDLPATEFLLTREDEWLRVKWNEDNPWQLKIKKNKNQINSVVNLAVNLGSLAADGSVGTSFRWIDAACAGAWGTNSVPNPVPGSFSQFSDGETVDLKCHLIGDNCPSSPVVGPCGGPGNQGFMQCKIQVREDGGSWTTVATSASGTNCDFNSTNGSTFASVDNFMVDHDDKTDVRCKAFHVQWNAMMEMCAETAKGGTKVDDWWLNNHTPNGTNVSINISSPDLFDDLRCDYVFSDGDGDSEDLGLTEFEWYVNGVNVNVDNQVLDSSNTNIGDSVVCSVRVYDDVFSTGNEVFVNSSNVTVVDSSESEGSLQGLRTFGSSGEDIDSTSYVFSGRNRIVELKDDEKVYLHNDIVGSSNLKTDDSGEVDSEVVYLPFGTKKLDTSSNSKSFFTGKETDDSGLQYFGARYYDPYSGRFTQVDPILRDSQSNYHYAENSPLKYIDPDGRSAITQGIKNWAKGVNWMFNERKGLTEFKQSFVTSHAYQGDLGKAALGFLLLPESYGDIVGNTLDMADGIPQKALLGKAGAAGIMLLRGTNGFDIMRGAGKGTAKYQLISKYDLEYGVGEGKKLIDSLDEGTLREAIRQHSTDSSSIPALGGVPSPFISLTRDRWQSMKFALNNEDGGKMRKSGLVASVEHNKEDFRPIYQEDFTYEGKLLILGNEDEYIYTGGNPINIEGVKRVRQKDFDEFSYGADDVVY